MDMNTSVRFLLCSWLCCSLLCGCGNSLEGGSEPSGSFLRVVSLEPTTFDQDIVLTECENGFEDSKVTVILKNESNPTASEENPTNSYVTMSRYRVDYAGINKSVTIPSLDGGGATVGIQKNEESTPTMLLVFDAVQREYIRSHYPEVGADETLLVRAEITWWGEDAFGVSVAVKFSVTISISDYLRCDG